LADSPDAIPLTPVRVSYERVRKLSLADQLADCADQLSHPEGLAADLAASLEMVRAWRITLARAGLTAGSIEPDVEGDPGALFYPSREIFVLGGPCSFTCLATGFDPLGAGETARDPIDYAAVTCDVARTPVFGAVQSERDASAYPLLLRGLATLVEAESSERLAALNESVFRGFLGRSPRFDLNLVLFEETERSERVAIEQFTRDLAEKSLVLLRDDARCAGLVGHIVCLRMNADRGDFRLRFGWSI